MSEVQVLLTVGKLDASLALLTTEDHHVIEFPTMLLPDDVKAGSIVKLSVSQNFEEENRQRELFKEIQSKILEKYGTRKPESPVLNIVNVTQTSCVLAWNPLSLGSARLKSLILYRQGVRSTIIPSPLKGTTTKISGLSVDTDYEFQLKLSTTSGQYWSDKVKLHTHKMTDMSGITVCLGALDPMQNISAEQVAQSLAQIGARPLQNHVAIDTTHFVTNDADNEEDPELIKAKNNNIPVVRPEWVRASEMERRIVGVRGFYLDADSSILSNYQFPPLTEEAKAKFSKLKSPEGKPAAETETATVGIQKELRAVDDNNEISNKVETSSNSEPNEEHGQQSDLAASASNKAMESVEDIPLTEEDLKDAVEVAPDEGELKEAAKHPTNSTLEEEEHEPVIDVERGFESESPPAKKEEPEVAIDTNNDLKRPEEETTTTNLKDTDEDPDAVVSDSNQNEAKRAKVAAEIEAAEEAVEAEVEAEAEGGAEAEAALETEGGAEGEAAIEAEVEAAAEEEDAEAEAAAEAEAEAKTVTEEMTETEVTPVESYQNESDAQIASNLEQSANVITSGEPFESTQEIVADAQDDKEEDSTHGIVETNEEGEQEVSRNTTPEANGNPTSSKSSKKKKDKKKRNKKK